MSEIIPEFLKNKFINDFKEASQEHSQKLPHYSQFLDIKDVLEQITITPSLPENTKDLPYTLKDLLYTLNDALAECVTFCEQRKAHKAKTPSLSERSFLRKIQKKLREISEKLHEILKSVDANADSNANPALKSSSSSSGTDDSLERLLYGAYEIHGFNEQLNKVEKMLLERKAIGIVGMGGSGKTALAQMVVNTVLGQKQFEVGFWVSLPDDYDTKTIVIVKSVRPDSKGYLWVERQDWTLQQMLEVVSSTSKCLIVLDGAKQMSDWYQEYFVLESRLIPSGSAVIVTSRLQEVAGEMVGKRNLHHLQLVSPESSWLIFKDTVEENGLIDADHPTLLKMKEEIVERCYGLPLAAKTLADIIPKQIYDLRE